ncbi:hypothetical protein MUK42_35200 [Musa troglodytarum]|uniref:Uncharacterized protein n=1 Tax=Musa troglodytarum TaxID=320322 RepID=A0A9E7FLL4_9LILI|nr:hypothetical protein MUK42_35200 [Musa troglodytarum]
MATWQRGIPGPFPPGALEFPVPPRYTDTPTTLLFSDRNREKGWAIMADLGNLLLLVAGKPGLAERTILHVRNQDGGRKTLIFDGSDSKDDDSDNPEY